MIKILKPAIMLAVFTLFTFGLKAQITQDPTKWTYEVKKKTNTDYELIFHLNIKDGWHIYAFQPGGDGSLLPPEFNFDKNEKIVLKGKVIEKGKLITERLEGIEGDVRMFKGKVDYVQHLTVKGNVKVTGKQDYQVCNDQMCLPPKTVPFAFEIKDAAASSADTTTSVNPAAVAPVAADSTAATDSIAKTSTTETKDTAKQAIAPPTEKQDGENGQKPGTGSMLMLFFSALGGGLLAVLTPCVYSMIPITVSFFTKRSKSRAEGIRNAIYYSLSIIIIFTLLGILISLIFGANALNSLSTNWIANLFFFAIFVIFGISFLGAFEITLPSSWTSKTDSKAGLSSFGGIFFMALTLVIVSFSCTGPIVGPLLVIASKGGISGPAVGMLGFSMGLALPFALFAIFPSMLNKIASSGGWLNQVKVVLGFIELMLAMKFLSNADLSQGWRILDREVFIAVWIVISILLGIYLLGKLKLSHDDAPPKNVYGQEYVSIFKLFLAIGAFTFAVYLTPGMWGAPLNGMSAFIPPLGTQDFIATGGSNAPAAVSEAAANGGIRPEKYVNDMKRFEPPVVKNLGLETFFDYDEAVAAAKKLKKPIMLDFTGVNCVNCRKMESQVWSNSEVAKRLKEDFIVVSLYCDMNSIELPKEQQYFSKDLNSQVTTLGNKNSDLEASKFNNNAMPIYFYVDENGNKLAEEGYSYDPSVEKFIQHLDKVKAKYKESHS